MMMSTRVDARTITPIDHDEAMRIIRVELVCILSGRGSGTGLLAYELPL